MIYYFYVKRYAIFYIDKPIANVIIISLDKLNTVKRPVECESKQRGSWLLRDFHMEAFEDYL